RRRRRRKAPRAQPRPQGPPQPQQRRRPPPSRPAERRSKHDDMSTAYIGLGSNLGDSWNTLHAVIRRLRAEPGLRLVAASQFYESSPIECPPGSSDFLNAAVSVETERSPEDLLGLLH